MSVTFIAQSCTNWKPYVCCVTFQIPGCSGSLLHNCVSVRAAGSQVWPFWGVSSQ